MQIMDVKGKVKAATNRAGMMILEFFATVGVMFVVLLMAAAIAINSGHMRVVSGAPSCTYGLGANWMPARHCTVNSFSVEVDIPAISVP